MKKFLFSFLIIPILQNPLFAQLVVEGRVVDEINLEPVSFAAIQNIRDNSGVQSDIDGKFQIQCLDSDSLSISCLGYKKSILPARQILQGSSIRIRKDTLDLNMITISEKSISTLLNELRNNTISLMKKVFCIRCNRRDSLLFKDRLERTSEAEVYCKIGNKKKRIVNYWLSSLESESFSKVSKQPYLSYPVSLPFFRTGIVDASEKEEQRNKYFLIKKNKSQAIISIKSKIPSSSFIDSTTFYINNYKWVIDSINFNGGYYKRSIKKWNNYHFSAKGKLVFSFENDSIVLSNFGYSTSFSHREDNRNNLWHYSVDAKLRIDNNIQIDSSCAKLSKNDYLLFKNKMRDK